LVEAWGIVRETYVDPTFNNQDWDLKLEEVLGETLSLKTSDAAYAKIRSMLATLGDPFTRIVNPQEYESFRISNEGALEGVGLLIASDRDSGRLVVLSPIEGGPAARAGIISGDELVQIDGNELLHILFHDGHVLKLWVVQHCFDYLTMDSYCLERSSRVHE
jgi:carboxyl-terminal processing protease